MFGGNSYMRGPGGPGGRGPGGRGPGGFGGPGGHGPGGFGGPGRGPRGFGGPRGPYRPGGFHPHHFHRHYHRPGFGGPPPGMGCMGCLLPILSFIALLGGAVLLLLFL